MAVVQGSNPSLLRHAAAGLRATATVMAGVSTTYTMLASIESMKLKRGVVGFVEAAENATRQTRVENYQRKAKEYSELSTAMFGAANAADTKAVTQEAVSDASGFNQPTIDLPDLPDSPIDDGLSDDSDPIGDLPIGGGGGGLPGGGLPGFGGSGPGLSGSDLGAGAGGGGEPYLGGAGDSGDSGADPDVAPDTADSAADRQEQDQGVLGLIPGGPVGFGVGAAAVAAGGIAVSVILANRRNRQRQEDEGEERERDGDKVEAVYQTRPPERPAAG